MSAAAELVSRVRISSPRPAHCSACFRGAEEGVRFVDFDAGIDRGQRVVERDGVVWERESIDDLHVCESCVREATEVLALKPQVSANQLREIRRLELAVEHWQAYAKRLEATLKDRPEPVGKARR